MLAEVIWYAAYSCVFAYEVPVVEVQRLVAIHGFTLVFAISDSDYHKPVFQVVAREVSLYLRPPPPPALRSP